MKNTSAESFPEVERVPLAVGAQPSIEDLGLEALGVELDRGFIKTDTTHCTNVFGSYTTGDVAGPLCPVRKASHEGVICTETLAGVEGTHSFGRDCTPGYTYSRPQVTSLGLTESVTLARGWPVRIGKFSYQSNGKTLANGEAEGFVKTISDTETGELLDAHMVDAQVAEQIRGFGIARYLEIIDESLLSIIFAHSIFSGAMYESILTAHNHPLHQ